MPNHRHSPIKSQPGAKTGVKGSKGGNFKEKTPNWPGVPGKTGPNRSNGVKKAPTHPSSEGI